MSDIVFKEVPESRSGIGRNISYGAAWGDFNGDKYPDLWVNNHYHPASLYLNKGNGTFQDVTDEVIVEEQANKDQHGTAWADFDNDGDQDLIQIVGGGRGVGNGSFFANELYVNEGGKLEDFAPELGVDYFLARGRSPLWLDYNNDGLLDLIVGAFPRSDNIEAPAKIFQQQADGTFVDASKTTGFNFASAPFFYLSDLSGDGKLDLVIRDYKNNPPFKVYDITSTPFTDITSKIIPSFIATSENIAINDFNNDLLPDVYLTTGGDYNDVYQDGTKKVVATFRAFGDEKGISIDSSGNITFDIYVTDGQFSVPLNEVYIGAGGINPTGWEFTLSSTDPKVVGIKSHTPGVDRGIYIGYDPKLQRWDFLLSSTNQSNSAINLERLLSSSTDVSDPMSLSLDESIASEYLLGSKTNNVPLNTAIPNTLTAFIETSKSIADVTAIGFQSPPLNINDQLLINSNQGLIDKSQSSGINAIPVRGYQSVTGDFDNDMDIDIYVVTGRTVVNSPNVLFENQGDGTFVVVPNAGGATGTKEGQGDFAAVADYDLDGFLDLFVGNGEGPTTPLNENAPYQLFQNQGNNNHWLQIDLQGRLSNRDGIGAQVFATAGGVTQLREQSDGNQGIQNHRRIHFGLGDNVKVDKLIVKFPSGRVLEAVNIPADQLINVIEPGGSNQDKIKGGKGNDIIAGKAGNDILNGKKGNDYLYGDVGNDTLKGGSGKDNLVGGDGNDLLNGGKGNDFLTGNLGNDIFLLQKNKGTDTITDFQNGKDKFQLKGDLTFEQLKIEQFNKNTQISIASDNQILGILLNINTSIIDASDFI